MMQIEYHTITEESASQRLDNYLMRVLRGAPKSLVYRMIRKGEVRVNKKRAQPLDRLKMGDVVRVPQVLDQAKKPDLSHIDFSWIPKAVLYEDEALLVLNKPSGIAVHGGSQLHFGLIDGVKLMYPEYPAIELAHRIDRDTSGCLVLAKKRAVLKEMHALFLSRAVQKTYHTIVLGRWPKQLHSIDAPLKRVNQGGAKDRMVMVSAEGQEAVTTFEPIKITDHLSLIAAHPYTGRTHQIRVHTLHAGHPILGDTQYCKRQLLTTLPEDLSIKRMYLHALKIQFAHPLIGTRLTIEAPYDHSFVEIVQDLDRFL